MKVCLVAEGCYPYVVGGVSSWVHSLIGQFPNLEFAVTAIIAGREQSGKFAYKLPPNVTEVREIYLNDCEWQGGRTRASFRHRLSRTEFEAMRSLVIGDSVDWETIFRLFQEKQLSLNRFLMGPDFLKIAEEVYELRYGSIVFSDFLWTLRSIYLPLGFALQHDPVKADLYHCVATGYSGIVGSLASWKYGGALLISEHGIYTREREEEIIKAKWVTGVYKDFWIEQFRKMSLCAYQRADLVTSLFEDARSLQLDLGCPREKTRVTPNGVDITRFAHVPGKEPDDPMIHIGAAIRVTPIKDVKTLINAFYYAKQRDARLKLWIMGPWEEDREYAQECFELVESLHVQDIVFTGRIRMEEYIGRMDALILTSISEGQPLVILEGFSAKKPSIATNVGNCRGLLYGEGDDFGPAGILTPPMNIEKIADAMVAIAADGDARARMGEAGYRRVCSRYRVEQMRSTYRAIYQELAQAKHVPWPEDSYRPHPEQEGGKSHGGNRN